MGGESKNAKNPAKKPAVVDDALDSDETEIDFDDEEPGTVPKRGPETLKPAFDVEQYAADTAGREPFPTIVDEDATEQARIASVLMDSTPPRAAQASAPQIGVLFSEVDVLSNDEQLALLRARLAPMHRVPRLVRTITELGPVIQDPKTAYVLGFVDGLLPLETIVEVAGLPEIEALRILDRALEQHVLTFSRPNTSGRGVDSSRSVKSTEQQSRKKR